MDPGAQHLRHHLCHCRRTICRLSVPSECPPANPHPVLRRPTGTVHQQRLDDAVGVPRSLGDQGYTPIEILRYYYGDNMYINTAEAISGIPSSWPGYDLEIGSSGNKVRQMQEQLNVIAGAYPAIPKINADGIYGPATAEAVRVFQSVFGLPQTGVTDYSTWYKISEIYVGVSRIAELS